MSNFFAIPITDEWGTTYQLTTAGYTALVVLMLALLLLACFIGNSVKQPKFSARQLAFSAMAIAAAFVTSEIKLFHLPFGGSITLFSMLFLVLIGYWYGLRAGLMTAIAYGFLQLVSDPHISSASAYRRCSLITSSHSVRSAYPACFPNRKTVW
ncbi:energy-coupled thiamine transporter ThiT [Gallintestinimicrobium sp.]|uniref:energy-coupled thiamine transporter ThiT n=1 Tax=Gallintestinimicrobium sp. TaxID=2981655 RepID=UPI003999907C